MLTSLENCNNAFTFSINWPAIISFAVFNNVHYLLLLLLLLLLY